MAIGQIAMQANTIGHRNIAVGGGALSENVSGNFNACIGDATMILNTSGSFNRQLDLWLCTQILQVIIIQQLAIMQMYPLEI